MKEERDVIKKETNRKKRMIERKKKNQSYELCSIGCNFYFFHSFLDGKKAPPPKKNVFLFAEEAMITKVK